jgi:hypothetical protein
MVIVGVALVAVGVLFEVIGGTLFRDFFDWTLPDHRHDRVSGRQINLRCSRVGLLVGLFVILAGLVADSDRPTGAT